jgi:gluconokinase
MKTRADWRKKDARMHPRLAIVMGVNGSGKSVVGSALAQRLGLAFRDADSFHSQANIDKMAAGHPLDDSDRAPWLAAIGAWLGRHRQSGAIVTCSALKRKYRDAIRAAVGDLPFLHLDGPVEVVEQRVAGRPDHFMPACLVRSQLEALEHLQPDEVGVRVDFTRPVEEIVDELTSWLGGLR